MGTIESNGSTPTATLDISGNGGSGGKEDTPAIRVIDSSGSSSEEAAPTLYHTGNDGSNGSKAKAKATLYHSGYHRGENGGSKLTNTSPNKFGIGVYGSGSGAGSVYAASAQ